jgi:hypothetical protein
MESALLGRAPRLAVPQFFRAVNSFEQPRTAATTFSTVKPNSLNSAPAGADSPKRSMPTTAVEADVLPPAVGDAGLDGHARQ